MISRRIGFYVCHCGTNIAGKVRVDDVVHFMNGQPGVVVARDYKFMCSDPGQEMIQHDIRALGLNRVVVASCSPRLHEKTFQSACERAGLNSYLFQMACIREHCSWVTDDPDAATEKAKRLAMAAVRRVDHHKGLESRTVPVHPGVLVLGAGIAGIQAALDVARAGQEVFLVEREPCIGGHMVQFDKTFPTLDCAACISTPKTVAVSQSPDIRLFSYSEITDVKGYVGNYTVTIRRKPRYVREDRCTGCGQCTEVCPVSLSSEFDERLGTRKAIYRSFPQAVPITTCIEKKDRAPCVNVCPAGVNAQGYIQLVRQGKYLQAVELIMERVPLPGSVGRLCPAPCEVRCRRAEVDSPVAIRELKRLAADRVDWESLPVPPLPPPGERPRRVAVIGGGPAGLTVATDLRRKGFGVTLFEAESELGGHLRRRVSPLRLPTEVINREIDALLRWGIGVRTGVRLGEGFDLEALRREGFAAIVVAVGASLSLPMNVAGESSAPRGLVTAEDFLAWDRRGAGSLPEARVIVVGGNSTAVDAARVARRLAAEVILVTSRSRAEMPAAPLETDCALSEGVVIEEKVLPASLVVEDGRVTGLRCVRTNLTSPDESGRRRPIPVAGSAFFLPCHTVITALGAQPDEALLRRCGLEVTPYGTVAIHPVTLQTNQPDVFAAGEAACGMGTIIDAIALGHRAADAVDAFLSGADMTVFAGESLAAAERLTAATDWRPIPEDTPRRARFEPPHRPREKDALPWSEISPGFNEEDGRNEASRCLNCGVCAECKECVRVCERQAVDHAMKAEEIQVKVGSLIVATGYDIFDPSPLIPYGYGRFPDVYTGLEFERLNNAVGPTGGRIVTRDGRTPRSVAIIHCVGSRDERYHVYCSRVCCMYALKYGHLIKEKTGHGTKVFNFYIDMRCTGKGYEEFYRRIQEEGVTFVRGRPGEITDALETEAEAERGRLVVVAEDTLLGRKIRVPADMVILCTAMEARRSASDVARVVGINQGSDGFFLEEHPKLGPMSTPTEGVFLAGACQGPKDIPDTVSHAAGAAAQALALATRGTVAISSVISWIDPDVCAGCGTCVRLCPYSAIELDLRRGVSVVNEALCKGCGSCAGFCPSGAARVKHFTARQVFAEIEGLLDVG